MNRTRTFARVALPGFVAAAIMLALPVSAFAQRGAGGGFGQNPGMALWMALDDRFDEVSKQLTLTETQTESVKTLLKEFTEKNASVSRLKKIFADMRASRGQGRRGGGGAAGGRGGGGMQGMQEMRTLMQELGPAFEELHEKVTGLLDEEQKKSLTTLLQRRRPGG
ncbi:MAG: Spy/CpxP family protein refolding chaperone [Gemmatimonadota bacterium]|nr:Spy/CpxP family protein refolding chaperone [Gemmatimonadota bacterium]